MKFAPQSALRLDAQQIAGRCQELLPAPQTAQQFRRRLLRAARGGDARRDGNAALETGTSKARARVVCSNATSRGCPVCGRANRVSQATFVPPSASISCQSCSIVIVVLVVLLHLRAPNTVHPVFDSKHRVARRKAQ